MIRSVGVTAVSCCCLRLFFLYRRYRYLLKPKSTPYRTVQYRYIRKKNYFMIHTGTVTYDTYASNYTELARKKGILEQNLKDRKFDDKNTGYTIHTEHFYYVSIIAMVAAGV